MSNGKGDTPRPISVDNQTYENNWERTFGTKKKKFDEKVQALQADIDKLKQRLEEHDKTNGTADGDN